MIIQAESKCKDAERRIKLLEDDLATAEDQVDASKEKLKEAENNVDELSR